MGLITLTASLSLVTGELFGKLNPTKGVDGMSAPLVGSYYGVCFYLSDQIEADRLTGEKEYSKEKESILAQLQDKGWTGGLSEGTP
ncbi:MAG TPA: hypothetical protein H9671_01710 [Firmicutes bacterium]|nr:hypothetical protein [Bacillota bacterium]